uniref:Uncharacterized protein n=1 Tax=Cannabis sativa TaxID=3483 RepID=A0A803Q7Q2_CANSA
MTKDQATKDVVMALNPSVRGSVRKWTDSDNPDNKRKAKASGTPRNNRNFCGNRGGRQGASMIEWNCEGFRHCQVMAQIKTIVGYHLGNVSGIGTGVSDI